MEGEMLESYIFEVTCSHALHRHVPKPKPCVYEVFRFKYASQQYQLFEEPAILSTFMSFYLHVPHLTTLSPIHPLISSNAVKT